MSFIDESYNESRNNEVMRKVLGTAKKYFDMEKCQEGDDVKLNYYSFAEQKKNMCNHDTSRQKL